MNKVKVLALSASVALMIGCSDADTKLANSAKAEVGFTKVNQLGYLSAAKKLAVVPAVAAAKFDIIDVTSGKVVFTGSLSDVKSWNAMGDEPFKLADFSALQAEGSYRLVVQGVSDSYTFDISPSVYSQAHDGALKAYYYNRASTELTEQYAGAYARPEGHPDTDVRIFDNAASAARPADTSFAAPKGWYDAGDYGKYIVNSGISTYTLMAAYEHFPSFYNQRDINIPESGDAVPDILDEVMWNLEWMQAMQDPNDGGVYHKLTTLNFSGAVMPHEATAQRYFIKKSTAATLDFAAVMATASRVYAPFEGAFPGKAAAYRQAAITAWEWAQANPSETYSQTSLSKVQTGAYGDKKLNDEFAWAAAELFILTGEQKYWQAFNKQKVQAGESSWANVAGLGFISLANNARSLLNEAQYKTVTDSIVRAADSLLVTYKENAYQVPIGDNDFFWGGNSGTLNRAWVLLEANKIKPRQEYIDAALAAVDYIYGRNPTNYSFVTGFGDNPAVGIHHRPSYADGIKAPVPGWLAGGAHNGKQDGCEYPSDAPAKSYLDDWCSYSTNEIAINWNAPLVYVLAAVNNL